MSGQAELGWVVALKVPLQVPAYLCSGGVRDGVKGKWREKAQGMEEGPLRQSQLTLDFQRKVLA